MQTILIIDDDETIGDLEQEVLTRAGYRTLRAYAGTEALLLLKEQQPDPVSYTHLREKESTCGAAGTAAGLRRAGMPGCGGSNAGLPACRGPDV